MKIKVKSKLIFFALACLVAAIVLMILPYGIIMRWSAAPGGTDKITYHSYFDFTPYAYGHFFPPIIAIVTSVSAVFVFLYIFLNKFRLAALILTSIAAVCSIFDSFLGAILFSFDITAINISVPILLAATAALQIVHRLHRKG